VGEKRKRAEFHLHMVVKEKGRGKSTERGSVHDEEYRAENRALGNTTRRCMNGRDVVITFNTKGAR